MIGGGLEIAEARSNYLHRQIPADE